MPAVQLGEGFPEAGRPVFALQHCSGGGQVVRQGQEVAASSGKDGPPSCPFQSLKILKSAIDLSGLLTGNCERLVEPVVA